MEKLPVFMHHEIIDDFRDDYQEYPIYALKNAKLYNNKIVLFGNKLNYNWWPDWVDTNKYLGGKWKKFVLHYKNMALYYNESWQMAFYKRLFAFYEYALAENISEFIMIDSDVLIYKELKADDLICHYDNAACMNKRQDIIGSDGMRQSVALGIAYWRVNILEEFLNFIINMYRDESMVLYKKYKYHLDNMLPGGVSETTLMWHWWKSKRFSNGLLNCYKRKHAHVYQALIYGSENYLDNEYIVEKHTGMKKVIFHSGLPYIVCNSNGMEIIAYSLHFNSQYKQYMKVFYEYSKLQLRAPMYSDIIKKNILDSLLTAKKIYIYGIGEIADLITCWLENHKLKIANYIISKKTTNPPKNIKKVITLAEFHASSEFVVILASVKEHTIEEMKHNLRQCGQEKIVEFDAMFLSLQNNLIIRV